MSEPRSPPGLELLTSLRSAARLIFLAQAMNVISSILLLSGQFPGFYPAQAAADPLLGWSVWLSAVTGLAFLVVCMRFAWPLLDTRRPPDGLLDSSLRRLATLWRFLGMLVLLGVLLGVGLLVWILTTS